MVNNNLRDNLSKEWHARNEKPLNTYKDGSRYKAWWECSFCFHEWQATISNRIKRGSNCPNCRKLNSRGANNPKWTGYGEIGGKQWLSIQREAERRKIPFEITIEEAWQMFEDQEQKCALTGRNLSMMGKRNGEMSGNAALDRIDPTQGFTADNSQWIEKRLQQMKRNLSDREFVKICEAVAMHHLEKKPNFPPSFKEWSLKASL